VLPKLKVLIYFALL